MSGDGDLYGTGHGDGGSVVELARSDTAADVATMVEVPTSLDVLEDGSDTLTIGDVSDLADYNHEQGDNEYGFLGTCGLVSCEDILNQFGGDFTEDDIVEYAVDHHLCNVTGDAESSGGTTRQSQTEILRANGVPAHSEYGDSLGDLAQHLEQGAGVIIEANAGVLWDDPNAYDNGGPNHAVVVTGVARDPDTGDIQGFYINDSGTGESGEFVSADTMTQAWADAGGQAVVTDVVHGDDSSDTGDDSSDSDDDSSDSDDDSDDDSDADDDSDDADDSSDDADDDTEDSDDTEDNG